MTPVDSYTSPVYLSVDIDGWVVFRWIYTYLAVVYSERKSLPERISQPRATCNT